jgi:hypothetical protein
MPANFSLDNIDDIKATLTVTMTVGEWREVLKSVEGPGGVTPWPRSILTGAVRDILLKVERHFFAAGMPEKGDDGWGDKR